jgi:hypothetical protein
MQSATFLAKENKPKAKSAEEGRKSPSERASSLCQWITPRRRTPSEETQQIILQGRDACAHFSHLFTALTDRRSPTKVKELQTEACRTTSIRWCRLSKTRYVSLIFRMKMAM